MSDVVLGPTGFVAVGGDGGRSAVWTSTDGFAWARIDTTQASIGSALPLTAVVALDDGYVAAGPDQNGGLVTLWTSTDGISSDRVQVLGEGERVCDCLHRGRHRRCRANTVRRRLPRCSLDGAHVRSRSTSAGPSGPVTGRTHAGGPRRSTQSRQVAPVKRSRRTASQTLRLSHTGCDMTCPRI